MTEKLPEDPFEVAQDQQVPTSIENTTSSPRGSPFSLVVIIKGTFILLFLVFAVYFYANNSTIASIFSVIGLVLALPSTGKRATVVEQYLYTHLEKRSQHLARVLRRLWKNRWIVSTMLSSLVILGLLLYILIPLVDPPHKLIAPKPRPTVTTNPISVIRTSDGAYVGLSSGLTNFDTNRADGSLKDEAAQALKANDTNAAKGYWQLAIREDETDAEACIYQENQNVLDSSSNDYVTLVVVATLTGHDKNAINVGRSILQGACAAQKEYNSQHKLPNGRLVRLLIANVDNPSLYADGVAQQIEEAVKNDTTTLVGVMGQLSNADIAIQELSKAHIPMISSTSLYSTVETSYLFSVAPSLQREAVVAANAAIKLSQHVALFYDADDPYSSILAQAFNSQFTSDEGTLVENTYTTGQATDTLPGRVDGAMSSTPTPGLIYLAGYPDDASFLVPYVHSKWPGVQVMGGDALYQYVHSYITLKERAAFNSLLFTSFAFHDEWAGHMAQKPAFFNEYAQDFDAQKQHAGNLYGYLLPDSDVILSYDAANVFLKASSDILIKGNSLTPQTLWSALQRTSSFAGVSGQIVFGQDGEPLEKAIVLLQVEPSGTKLLDIQGRYP